MKNLITNQIDATSSIKINKHPHVGESYINILKYFYPELITSFIIYSAISLLDSYFISQISLKAAYATAGVTNSLFHFITKIADAFVVGMIVLCGQYNGVGQVKEVGKTVTDGFWTTCFIGGIVSAFLYFAAPGIYHFYGVPSDMIEIGVPFLRLRSISVFFNFVVFALIGFLRGIKNTKTPMYLFMLGALVFVFFDYALIFGKCGCPCLDFQGSAIASIIQYASMLIAALLYIFKNPEYRQYGIQLFSTFNINRIKTLMSLSWPVMLDKASLAICHMWLFKMIRTIAFTNTQVTAATMISSLTIIRDIERFAFLPGLAFAQIITFLVSNEYKANNWDGIRNNIKKVMLLSFVMVSTMLVIFSFWPSYFVQFFDKHNTFSTFAASVIPCVSILVLFDLLQLILSASLRGASDVKTVMWVRLLVTFFYFIPASYLLSLAPIENVLIKFIVIYGSLHIGNAIMSLLFIKRFLSGQWKRT